MPIWCHRKTQASRRHGMAPRISKSFKPEAGKGAWRTSTATGSTPKETALRCAACRWRRIVRQPSNWLLCIKNIWRVRRMKNTFRVHWPYGLGLVVLCLVTISSFLMFRHRSEKPAVAQQVSCSPEQAPYFEALGIRTDFQAAAKIAEKEKKPLVLLFSVNNASKPGFQ